MSCLSLEIPPKKAFHSGDPSEILDQGIHFAGAAMPVFSISPCSRTSIKTAKSLRSRPIASWAVTGEGGCAAFVQAVNVSAKTPNKFSHFMELIYSVSLIRHEISLDPKCRTELTRRSFHE